MLQSIFNNCWPEKSRGKENVKILSSLKYFLFPRNNHWLKRTFLVFAFIFFDYFVTLMFCQAPHEEANLYARSFMVSFGVPLGLTLFVLAANMPIYMTLSLDSHIIRLPSKIAVVTEFLVDIIFAWFIAGLHFSGGTSWLWSAPQLTRQTSGMLLYLAMAFILVKPHQPHYNN